MRLDGWNVLAVAVLAFSAAMPAPSILTSPLSPDTCVEAAFTPPLPLSFATNTSYPFAVDFGTTFRSISKVTATSRFPPNGSLDRGERYFIFNFGGQESSADNVTSTILIQRDPAVLREFMDGYYSGSFTSEAGSFTLTSLLFCVEEGQGETSVSVDIRPGSCPNPLNVKSRGVLPVAILGTSALNVSHIDISSVKIEGVPPLRLRLEDVATPPQGGGCTTAGPDGLPDLSLKFDLQAVAQALGPVMDRQVRALRVTCTLWPEFGASPLSGEDLVVILAR